jgi:hypothetical protein
MKPIVIWHSRTCRWPYWAYRQGDAENGWMHGCGETEQEAIDDLMRLELEEREADERLYWETQE